MEDFSAISPKVFLICFGLIWIPYVTSQRDSFLHYTITEDLASNTLIGNILSDRTLQPDTASELSFSLVARDGNALPESMFKVDAATGNITSALRIDRELICARKVSCQVRLDVEVQPAEYFEIIRVAIEIIDINDNPPSFVVGAITKSISEAAAIGSTLALRAAYDPDSPAFGVQSYEQISDSFAFRLSYSSDLDTEEIFLILQSKLDRESTSVLTLKVYAHDGGTPPKSSSVTVNIAIQDTNDNNPTFDKATFEIDVPEDLSVGEILKTITATDPDVGDNGAIVYRFSSRSQDSFSDLFRIGQESGEIQLLRGLDYEVTTSYTLIVIAENLSPGATFGQTVININVIDVNDNSPEIKIDADDPPVAEVDESAAIGHFVAYIAVTDADSEQNGAVTCSVRDSSHSFDLVQMYTTDFKIVTTHLLDRESVDHHVVTISCQDHGTPSRSSEEELYIRVLDANDNNPLFGQLVYHAGLTTNGTVGSLIAQVQATDQDSGDNAEIRYGLARGGEGRVVVDPLNGTVTLADNLDGDVNMNWLNFTIYATDGGQPSLSGEATVVVQIFDENELVPHFTSTVYAFTVKENVAIGTSIGTVKLLNAIFPNFKPFRFDIMQPKAKDLRFAIEETSGLIRTDQLIDREEKDTYNLQVTAQAVVNDQAIKSIATVTIWISDENDQLPYFIFPSKRNNTIYIKPDTPPAETIATIAAKDTDSGQNARLTFSIFTGDPLGYFHLDRTTGHLVLAQDLRSVDPQMFSLVLKAEDNGQPHLSEEATLNIILRASSSMNIKWAIYLGVALGVALMLIVICVVVIKQKRTAKKCKKVERMLDEKTRSLENMSQKSHVTNLSHGSSEMEVHRAQGLIPDDKRNSFCQNPQFGYLGDRDSDSGCSTDLSNADSNKGGGSGHYSAMPNGQAYNGALAGRGPLWNSHIPEDGPYHDNDSARRIPLRPPRGFVGRSLSASVAEQQALNRQQHTRLSFPVTSSSTEHLPIHHNQGFLGDEMASARDVSIDSSDSERVLPQRLPAPVYSRLAKMNLKKPLQHLSDPSLYDPMYRNEMQQRYCPYGSRYSDDESQRGRLQSDEESKGHRSDTALTRSHLNNRRSPRKRRTSRSHTQAPSPSRHDLYSNAMLPTTHVTPGIVGNKVIDLVPTELRSRIPPGSLGHGTASSSLSESDVAQSHSTSDSRRTTGITSSDDEADELGVTQV